MKALELRRNENHRLQTLEVGGEEMVSAPKQKIRWCGYCGRFQSRHTQEKHFIYRAKRRAASKEYMERTGYLNSWRGRNPDKVLATFKRWRKKAQLLKSPPYLKILEQYRKHNAKTREVCRDTYIRRLLVNRHNIKQPTHEQIENHRTRIQAKRSRRFFRTLAGASAFVGK